MTTLHTGGVRLLRGRDEKQDLGTNRQKGYLIDLEWEQYLILSYTIHAEARDYLWIISWWEYNGQV